MSDRDVDYKNPNPRVSSLLCVRLRGREFRIDFGGHVCVQLALNLDSNDCRVRATQAIRGSLRISVFDRPSGPGRRISKEGTIEDVLKLLDF